MITKYNDPEVEAGFKLWYGQNSNYPVSNAYSHPEFYRSVKRDFETYKNSLNPQSSMPESPAYKMAGNNFVPPQPRKPQAKETLTSKYNGFSRDDPWYELKTFVRDSEKMKPYPYLDKNGKVTECDGNLDETYEEFESHPWLDKITGLPATSEQKRQGWQDVKKQPLNHKAPYYEKKTNLKLDSEYCDYLLDYNIKTRDEELKRGFPNYSKMSQSMKNALQDVHFTSNAFRFGKARKAARKMEKDKFCNQLHRDETNRPDMIERNDWVSEQCKKGHFYK